MDYFDSGYAVRRASWHGKERLLDEAPETWPDARQEAGLTWEPEPRPSFITRYAKEFKLCRDNNCARRIDKAHSSECSLIGDGNGTVSLLDCVPAGSILGVDGEHVFVPDPEHRQVLRNDTFALLETGQNASFQLVYHGKGHSGSISMEEIIDAFIPAGAKFDTSGAAKGGALVWAVMMLDEPFSITGDPHGQTLPYFALLNGHTGAAACKLVNTEVRVVCANTWQMADAQGDASGQQIVFRHSGDMEAKLEAAKQAVSDLREEVVQYIAMSEVMQQVHVTDKQVAAYLTEFLPSPRELGEQCTDRVHENVLNARSTFNHYLTVSDTCEGIEDTMYGVMAASTEYLDHARRYRSKESYVGRTILGQERVKGRALGIAADVFRSPLAKVKDESGWRDRLLELGTEERGRDINARPKQLVRS